MASCNYKVKITDIQNKYRFKIFCATNLSNFYTKDEVNNLLDDKANISDLDNYELLSNKVTTINSSSTDTQYPSAKGVYNSQEEQNEVISELETKLQDTQAELDRYKMIENALPHVIGEGTSITLDNTAEAGMKLSLGASELSQDGEPTPETPYDIHTISGDNTLVVGNKNLINITIIGKVPSISSGQLVDFEQGACTDFIEIDNTNDYILSYGNNATFVILFYDENYNYLNVNTYGVPTNYKLSTSSAYSNTKYIRLRIENYSNMDWVQLEKGSTATDYEPHQEQTAQLNLGDLEYSAIGDYKDEFMKPTNQLFQDEYIPSPNQNYTNAILKKGTYTISTCDNQNFGNTVYIKMYDKNNNLVNVDGHLTSPNVTVNFSTISYNYYVYAPSKSNIIFTIDDDYSISIGLLGSDNTRKVMLVKGSIVNNVYEPYNPNNKWYLKKNIGKVVLDGSESGWIFNGTQTTPSNRTIVLIKFPTFNTDYKSNYFIKNSSTSNRLVVTGGSDGGIYISLDDNITGIESSDTDTQKLQKIKDWLSTHNTIVDYVLNTPQYILLNDTLQEQLDIIESKLLSYKGQTSISQVNDDLPFVITSSAIMDLNTLVTRLEIIESEV